MGEDLGPCGQSGPLPLILLALAAFATTPPLITGPFLNWYATFAQTQAGVPQGLSSERLLSPSFTIKDDSDEAACEVCAEEPWTTGMIGFAIRCLSLTTYCNRSRMGLDAGHA